MTPMFCLIRHPEAGLGSSSAEALEHWRELGWVRVSEYRPEPGAFYLPDFADATVDLDAPAQPEPEPTKKKESKA